MFESIEVKERQSINQSVNQSWHAIHAMNAEIKDIQTSTQAQAST
jgi:hypothetical protein